MLLIYSFFTISPTTSWHALDLQLCTNSSADCESKKMRILDAGVGNPAWSMAMHDGFHSQLAASLIASSSVMCAST